MKNLKTVLFTILLLGAMLASNAQRKVVRVYPKHGTVVTTVIKPRVVVHKKTNFYFADGVWYKTKGKRYVVVNAPVGVKVRRLPRARKVVIIKGRKFYKYRGIWYKKIAGGYTVVTV